MNETEKTTAVFEVRSSNDGYCPGTGQFIEEDQFFRKGTTLEELAQAIKEFSDWGKENHFHLTLQTEDASIDAAIPLNEIGAKEIPFFKVRER